MQTLDGWRKRRATFAVAAIFLLALAASLVAANRGAFAQQRHHLGEKFDRNHPWMNPKLSPDERAAMVLKEMTLDEKIDLLHGMGMPGWPRDAATTKTPGPYPRPRLRSTSRSNCTDRLSRFEYGPGVYARD